MAVVGRVNVLDHVDEFNDLVDAKVRNALAAAGNVMAAIGTKQSAAVGIEWKATNVGPTGDGWAVGARASNPLFRVYDHGSLGKRTKGLKRNRRKASWEVKQRHRQYTAHRHLETLTDPGKGHVKLDITNPVRRFGRQTLINELRR